MLPWCYIEVPLERSSQRKGGKMQREGLHGNLAFWRQLFSQSESRSLGGGRSGVAETPMRECRGAEVLSRTYHQSIVPTAAMGNSGQCSPSAKQTLAERLANARRTFSLVLPTGLFTAADFRNIISLTFPFE